MTRVAESRQKLWIATASPVLWSVHFLASYITAALWCGKLGDPEGSLWTARLAIGGYTVVALAGIAIVGFIGYRAHSFGAAELPHDDDTPEDRHRFIGFATVLLSGLSFVGTVYTALAALFIETCVG